MGGRRCGWHFGRCLLFVIVLAGAFCAGASAGRFHARFAATRGMMGVRSDVSVAAPGMPPLAMMGTSRMEATKPIENRGEAMRGWFADDERAPAMMNATNTARIFGSIGKVEGAKITVIDNGAKERIVMSQSSTMISSSTGFLGLSLLKPGQTVMVMGKLAADGSVLADMIRIY